MKTEDIIRMTSSVVGRSARISREQMRNVLIALANAGIDLRNDSVPDTFDRTPDGSEVDGPQNEAQIARAARAWANACRRITVISVKPSGAVPHGDVRFDDPGQMAPRQRAAIMFAPAGLEGVEYDQIGQLRRKAQRVLIVKDDPDLN